MDADPAGVATPGVLNLYRDATIMVTGATGFLGKILLEKILRCMAVRKVYLLIRNKDNVPAQDRLRQLLLNDAVFARVRTCYPSEEALLAVVEAVEIDLNRDGLGIGERDTGRLLQETDILFNVLASVKFNETIQNALATNVTGARKILLFARRISHLKAVIHVSTLYSNCHRSRIEEKVYYDDTLAQETIDQLAGMLSADQMTHLQHCLLGPMPNTYTFSKKCAEMMIGKEFADMPIGIFRPPIVLSTYREPVPGWTDNLNGPSGLCVWTVKGFIRVIHGNRYKMANLVPVDYCVNAMIVAAYDVAVRAAKRTSCPEMDGAEQRQRSTVAWDPEQLPLPVYNYNYDQHNLTWGRYMELVSLGFGSRLHQVWWNYSYTIVSNRKLFQVLSVCCHTVPAVVLDMIQRLRGRRPRYQKLLVKTVRFLELMSYFGLRQWTVANENVRRLRCLLTHDEARLLEFDLSTVDWDAYFFSYIPGIRQFYFAEKPSSKKREHTQGNKWFHFLLRILHKLLCILFCIKLSHVSGRLVSRKLFSLLFT